MLDVQLVQRREDRRRTVVSGRASSGGTAHPLGGDGLVAPDGDHESIGRLFRATMARADVAGASYGDASLAVNGTYPRDGRLAGPPGAAGRQPGSLLALRRDRPAAPRRRRRRRGPRACRSPAYLFAKQPSLAVNSVTCIPFFFQARARRSPTARARSALVGGGFAAASAKIFSSALSVSGLLTTHRLQVVLVVGDRQVLPPRTAGGVDQ
jgi:hypothetical protein